MHVSLLVVKAELQIVLELGLYNLFSLIEKFYWGASAFFKWRGVLAVACKTSLRNHVVIQVEQHI